MITTPLKVVLQVATEVNDLPGETEFDAWANAAMAESNLSLTENSDPGLVTIRVVGDKESSTLNGDFRGIRKTTNVLAFPADNRMPGEGQEDEVELGDLAICYSVVAREAQEQSKTLPAHMAHMTVHGMLHLLGHDHNEAAEADVMEALEARIMAKLGFAHPYEH